MPKLSERRLAARRRGIVRAAARCIERNGLSATGMRDVFRAANLSPGAVYRYFAGKEELLAAVAAEGPGGRAPAGDAGGRGFAPLLAAAAADPAAAVELELRAAALRSPPITAALAARRGESRRRLAARLAGRGAGAADEVAELALAIGDGLALARLLEPGRDLDALVALAARLLAAAGPSDGDAEGVAQRQDDGE